MPLYPGLSEITGILDKVEVKLAVLKGGVKNLLVFVNHDTMPYAQCVLFDVI
jgi:hypothetical protein